MEKTSYVIIILIVGATIGALLGNRRQMGAFRGLLFGLFLNWVGWIIIAASDKPEDVMEKKTKTKWKKIILIVTGIILLLIAVLILIAAFTVEVPEGRNTPWIGVVIFFSAGFFVLKKGLKKDDIEE